MAQLNTSDFRKGSKIILDGEPFDMLEVNFVKPGKGQALYKCRLKNLIKGTMLDRTYKSGDSLEAADIRTGEGQFLYKDPMGLMFMDQDSFEQYIITNAVAGDQARFLQDNAVCVILFWGEVPIGLTAPAILDKFGNIARTYGLDSAESDRQSMKLPRTFLVDLTGRVRAIYREEGKDLEQVIEADLLAAKSPVRPASTETK